MRSSQSVGRGGKRRCRSPGGSQTADDVAFGIALGLNRLEVGADPSRTPASRLERTGAPSRSPAATTASGCPEPIQLRSTRHFTLRSPHAARVRGARQPRLRRRRTPSSQTRVYERPSGAGPELQRLRRSHSDEHRVRLLRREALGGRGASASGRIRGDAARHVPRAATRRQRHGPKGYSGDDIHGLGRLLRPCARRRIPSTDTAHQSAAGPVAVRRPTSWGPSTADRRSARWVSART